MKKILQPKTTNESSEKPNYLKYLTIFNSVAIVLLLLIQGFSFINNRNTAKAEQPSQPPMDNIDMAPLIQGAESLGGNDPLVNVVVFNSFTCGFCRKSKEVLHQLHEKYPQRLRIVFRHFDRNEIDQKASVAIECAGEQNKFWPMYDTIFGDHTGSFDFQAYARKIGVQINKFNQCMNSNKYASKISYDNEMGINLGVQGTPTFIVNGKMIVGYRPFNDFESLIKKYL